MKTINCRDDSLFEDRGMWTTMKKKKRCIIVAQGFYEWLKKSGGKEKIPHFTKRKDGQLMCFAGLWDCVQFEGMHTLFPLHWARSGPWWFLRLAIAGDSPVTLHCGNPTLCCNIAMV
jgi:putative SOS response-associated peptidase YedK